MLGEELPRSVQDLLSGYFKARNTTVAPSEIYCIQAHRVYSTIDKRRAVYRCFLTGQQVEVRAYSLPSMRHKNSEKLLVAAGRMFPQPIVLARIKPHSNDFRTWLGAADNGTGAPVIQRFIPEHLQGGKQAAEERRAEFMNHTNTKRRRTVKVEVEDDLVDEDNHDGPFVAMDDEDDDSVISSSTHRRRQLQSRSRTRETATGNSAHSQSPAHQAPVASTADSTQVPLTVAEHTTIHFISSATGEVARKRNLGKIENVESLFTHAFAADVVLGSKRLAVLEAVIGDQGPKVRIVDEDDYGDMVKAVVMNECWELANGCDVYVSGLG